jgi:hypothetical protein
LLIARIAAPLLIANCLSRFSVLFAVLFSLLIVCALDVVSLFALGWGQGLAVRVFKSAWFARFATKEGIGDEALKAAVDEMERGLLDADLGGNVYKKRIARARAGKSGGYRVIVFFKSGERMLFVYGFAKSDRENIRDDELRKFKDRAKDLFELSDAQIDRHLKSGVFMEIL